VFCDNSAFDDSAPPELWDVLLGEPGRLVLTERVNTELLLWRRKNLNHPVADAIRRSHAGISEYLEPNSGQPGRRVFDFYMALLGIRRRAVEVVRGAFRREHGRDPKPEEERCLAEQVQQEFGQRGRLLATKDPGYYTDEALVYLAVEHAHKT
jgi:hypothetical protein